MRTLIDLTINEAQLEKTVQRAKEQNIIVPTIAQMKNPDLIPASIKEALKDVELQDYENPLNLFRMSWYNEPKEKGGLYNKLPNYVEIPSVISGVKARIFAMSGKFFPIGAHKVGPAYACLVPRLVTGQFDPTYNEAVWPSTGNYCRGGAFLSKLLGCKSIAILPENMSAERFNWLKKVADEVIPTYGSESNVKEIYDETWRLRKERPGKVVIFNQFGELANNLWHYEVTGNAMKAVYEAEKTATSKLSGVCLTSGSAGTLGSGDFIKDNYKGAKLAVGEAIQCPTLMDNGFGEHWIEGIGDKHVPWIHNVKNSDMLIGVDDDDALALFRLFNEKAGQEYLRSKGVSEETLEKLTWVGISGAANIIMAIKMAKYYDMTSDDTIMTVLTDSAVMYQSRLAEMNEEKGAYTTTQAAVDHAVAALENDIDYVEELTYAARKKVHHLKYYTWIEQQQYDVADLNAQWYDYDNYWTKLHTMAPELDALVEQFNSKVGIQK